MMKMRSHIPVLFTETLDALAVKPGGNYIDGTLGRAGHTSEILARGGNVLGIDRDDDALKEVAAMKKGNPGLFKNLKIVKGTHSHLAEIAKSEGFEKVDGILLDLGVSSPQLDEAGRGFSFMREGPLDMRMDRSCEITAADILANSDIEELSGIFRTLGEEAHAHRIAKAIVAEREKKKFTTTKDLGDFIEKIIGRHSGKNPSTRVFQALRMAVNDEIGELERALADGLEILSPGGRFAVITFESITDRIVKKTFASHVGKNVSLQQGGERWEGVLPKAKAVTRHAVVAGEEELKSNPRARSAKLRAVEKEMMP